jgi:STE24 endopeptidase
MLETIVAIYTIYTFLRIYISVMQIGFLNTEKNKEAIILTPPKYFVAANYAIAKERVAIVEHFVDYLMFLWWCFGGFAYLASFFDDLSTITSSVLFLFGFIAINSIIGLVFEYYYKFKIDKEFHFNKMTPKMFFIDKLKSLALFVIIGGAIFALLSYIIASFDSWWIWGFVILFAVAVLANLLMPFFMGLFNKFSPLQDEKLKDEIESMMQKAGLISDGIFVMDASKRDSRLNAFFGGLGKSKRVVLYDTLLDKLTKKELLAVLGHELGHFSHKDIYKNIALIGVLLFLAFFIFGNLPDDLFVQMGVVPFAGVKIAMLMLLLPLLSFVFTPVMSYLSRHNEFEADKFGSQMCSAGDLVDALLKLVKENKSFPKAHPLVIFFYYTHPPVLERFKELGFSEDDIRERSTIKKEGIFAYLDEE